MDERQKYLYDLNGYLVVEDVLTRDHCQRLIDELARLFETPNERLPDGIRHQHRHPSWGQAADIVCAGPAFRELIDIPVVVDLLKGVVNDRLRLENSYCFWRTTGCPGLDLHGGGHFDGGGQDTTFLYRHRNGRIFGGLTVVAFALTDVSEGEGGFTCIPGSHKANFMIPAELRDLNRGELDRALIRCVPSKAGSVTIFTEALCHGAIPWASDRDRITLFYKYNHVAVKWHGGFPPDEVLAAMTPSQQAFYCDVWSDPRVPPKLPRVGDRWRELLPADLRKL